MKHQGKITIARYTGGRRGNGITVTIMDDKSGVQVVDVDMSIEEFSEALFGRAYQACEFEIRATHLGKKRETKTLRIAQPSGWDYHRQLEMAEAALKPYEIDGWHGNAKDLQNHHRRNDDGTYSVCFERWVEPDQT